MLEGVRSMKGSVLKKLKSISTISSFRQGFVFRAADLPEEYFPTPSSEESKESQKGDSQSEQSGSSNKGPEISTNDHEDQEPRRCQNGGSLIPLPDQIQLPSGSKTIKHPADSAADLQPVLESGCKGKEISKGSDELLVPFELLQEFEEKCPPGGNESIVFYTTSMRGIRKTFEDCNSIRFFLESFRVQYNERDVSLHMEYRDELWKIMGCRAVPPRLFIRGRYIGGADEVVGLHERGMLKKLLQGIPLTPNTRSCKGCAGVRFVLCFSCNGSRKIIVSRDGEGGCGGCDDDPVITRCSDCNENGLVKCPICNFNK